MFRVHTSNRAFRAYMYRWKVCFLLGRFRGVKNVIGLFQIGANNEPSIGYQSWQTSSVRPGVFDRLCLPRLGAYGCQTSSRQPAPDPKSVDGALRRSIERSDRKIVEADIVFAIINLFLLLYCKVATSTYGGKPKILKSTYAVPANFGGVREHPWWPKLLSPQTRWNNFSTKASIRLIKFVAIAVVQHLQYMFVVIGLTDRLDTARGTKHH